MKITKYIKKKTQKKHEPPQIVIEKEAFTKLASYTKAKKEEIMLLGVIAQKENTYFIVDFTIPPQTDNSGAFVTTDDDKYPKWLQERGRERNKHLRVHYHTHPNMSVTPSTTDQETIRDKVENISDFYIRIIGNEDLEFHIDFFDLKNELLYEEMNMYLFLEDYTIILGKKEPKIVHPILKDAEKQLDEMITKKPKTTTHVGYRNYGYNTYTGYSGYSNYSGYNNKTQKQSANKEIRKYHQLVQAINELIDNAPPDEEVTNYLTEELVNKLDVLQHQEILKIYDITKEEWSELCIEEMLDYFEGYLEIVQTIEEAI